MSAPTDHQFIVSICWVIYCKDNFQIQKDLLRHMEMYWFIQLYIVYIVSICWVIYYKDNFEIQKDLLRHLERYYSTKMGTEKVMENSRSTTFKVQKDFLK